MTSVASNAPAESLGTGTIMVGPSGNLQMTGTTPITLDLAPSLNVAGTITLASAAGNQIKVAPGATSSATATIESTGSGTFCIAGPNASSLALHVGAAYTPSTTSINLLSATGTAAAGGLCVYPNALVGTGNALVRNTDVALIANDWSVDTIGMVLAPCSSQGYGLRLDAGGNHTLGGAIGVSGTMTVGTTGENAIVVQPGSGSVAGAIHNTGTAPFWIQNNSTNGVVVARVGNGGTASTASFAALTPLGSGATGLHVYPYAQAASFNALVQAGDVALVANNQSPDTQGVFVGPYSTHGYGLRLDQGGTHALAGIVTNITGILESNGSPVMTAAGLSAALIALIQTLPTAPSSAGPTLWNNSGILTYT